MAWEGNTECCFHGISETIILSKDRIDNRETELIKVYVKMGTDRPNHIAVYNDKLRIAERWKMLSKSLGDKG